MDVAAFMSRYEAILKERKIPKMKFYQDCGFTDAAVSQWRRGKNIPSMKNIQTIANYLDTSVEYLLSGFWEKKENPAPEGTGFDAETLELKEIWDTATADERALLIDVARSLKKRRSN